MADFEWDDEWAGESYAGGADSSSAWDVPTSGISTDFIGPQPAPASAVSAVAQQNGGSWLSGLSALGSAAVNIARAVSPPSAGTTLYNPSTGLPYGLNPATGQAYGAPSAGTQAFVLFVLVAAAVIWFLSSSSR
jgi:hypothetical protein